MRGLEARLQRLEQAATADLGSEKTQSSMPICVVWESFELRRGSDALRAGMDGDEARAAEAESLLTLAHARRLEGWTQADTDALRKQEWDKKRAVWEFTGALGRRHEGFYPQSGRFDVLDLTEAEIKQLAEVAEKATCADDLDAVAEIVGRLRLDGRSWTWRCSRRSCSTVRSRRAHRTGRTS